MKLLNLMIIPSLMIVLSCQQQTNLLTISSPDGNIKIILDNSLDTMPDKKIASQLTYRVKLNDKTVILPSTIGISLKNQTHDFTGTLRLIKTEKETINETYTAISGKRSDCLNHANEHIFTFANSNGKKVNIIFRAYNDGIAYRYQLFNDQPDTIQCEKSQFNIPAQSIAWIQKFSQDYEQFYTERLVDTMHMPAYLAPGLFKTPNNQWVLASDAAVFNNYPAMQLVHQGNGKMLFQIPQQLFYASPWYKNTWEEVVMKEDNLVEAQANLITPWRALIIGDELADIVESNMIENLNPPCKLEDTKWIEPGVAVFPWWGNSIANDDPAILKDYIDMAAEMNWEYLEFDIGLLGNKGGFAANFWRDIAYIPEIISYAKKKGIKVYGWDERKNLNTPEKRADIFGTYQEWGVKGIKIDFLNSDKQEAMDFREVANHDAAKYNLLVSYHGEITPRGMRRTYPNIMTQEGVRGAEYYKFAPDNGTPTPKHNCTLPFTRNVVGPMDYTPTSFSTPRRKTTYVHELALPVIYESGWTCMADKPSAFLNSPAKDFLQELVAAWDDIHFIDGYPGKYCCLARRKGNDWFVAAINAGPKRWVNIDFDFTKDGKYTIKYYWDNNNPEKPDKLFFETTTVEKNDRIKFPLEKNGGFVFIIHDSH